MAKRILFQGDSITDMGRSREDENYNGVGYPTLVMGRLGYDNPEVYEFRNRGVSGNRIVDVYARIKSDIINLKPDYMSLLIGVNDVWHDDWQNGVSAPKFEMVYDLLISEIKEALPEIKIMLMEPFLLKGLHTQGNENQPDRWEYLTREVSARAEAVRRVAEKHGATFVPLQERFDEVSANTENSYWLYDGVHPTAMGAEVIARAWLEAFQTL
ncbi:MAG: lysophospholipase [Clostridiales bacterium]|nr:lysophospholipase [Clostridiales bacterium]